MVGSRDVVKGGHSIVMDDLSIYEPNDTDFEDGFIILDRNADDESLKVTQKINLNHLANIFKATPEETQTEILDYIKRTPYKLNKRMDVGNVDIRGYYKLKNIIDTKIDGDFLILTLMLDFVSPTGLDRAHPEEKSRWEGGLKVGKEEPKINEPDEEPSEKELAMAAKELSYDESRKYLSALLGE
jgi:hypothetical protein